MTNLAQVAVSTEAVKDDDIPAQTDEALSPAYTRDTALNKVASFIPSEAVAVYLALWAFIDPQSHTARWTVFAIGLALVPSFYVLAYLQRRRSVAAATAQKPSPSLRVTGVLLVFAMVSFVAWAAAMPGNPFLQLTDQALKIGGGAVIVLGVLLPKVSDALGLAAP